MKINAAILFEKYIKIKNERLQKQQSMEDFAYLNGWMDCAEFILKEQKND